ATSWAAAEGDRAGTPGAGERSARPRAGFPPPRLRVAAAGLGRAAFASAHSPLPRLAAVLARNGKPEQAWQRFEEGLGRSSGDEFAARRKRSPDERQRQTELLARLAHLDRRLPAVPLSPSTPAPEKQRQELPAANRPERRA